MKFELRYLISKKYSTIELTEHWIPIILRNKDTILTDSAELPEDMKEYDIVYAIKEEDKDNKYGYFAWKEEIAGDGKTHRFTLVKIVLDTSFGVSLVGGFLEHIISSLTNDKNNEYRVVIDRLDKPYKPYIDNSDTIRELCAYLSKRLSTEVEGKLADVFIQQITK